jgi:hypothetical protein
MDIFKQNKILTVTIIILVILNLATLSLLWLGKPKHDIIRGPENRGNEKVRIQEMLNKELGFSDEQVQRFIALREEHKEKTTKLSNDLMGVKKEMFEQAMYGDNVVLSDSLLNLSLKIQGQLEKVTFQHFLQLKQICTPKQRENLFKLMHRLLGPPEREGMGGPPPPPKDKQTPARG